jgi:rRNA maturation RNase YbeY
MNRRFLKHDYYTDIISFNLRGSKTDPIVGEIYISVDRIRENARINNVSINQELHRVMFHGVLHLCGYNDKTKPQQRIMRLKEDSYLIKYGLLVKRSADNK